ncbi:hypothetical protein NDU88_007574 [Pleurodeles waltl]|uniref:Uncharacterized protein n=1 Tax=Pleurodeles waltl TaxID=8319 RepID=A0AAV7U0F8_PLEWA|nr:hypothetical protein NDU88_007574 [Pleurodeles waltl]
MRVAGPTFPFVTQRDAARYLPLSTLLFPQAPYWVTSSPGYIPLGVRVRAGSCVWGLNRHGAIERCPPGLPRSVLDLSA